MLDCKKDFEQLGYEMLGYNNYELSKAKRILDKLLKNSNINMTDIEAITSNIIFIDTDNNEIISNAPVLIIKKIGSRISITKENRAILKEELFKKLENIN